MQHPTDETVIDSAVRRTQCGDTDAFELVVRHFAQQLRGWLAVHAPPGVDVDEIAQRTFVAAFTRIQDYQLGTSFGAWLFAIARFQLQTEVTRLRRVADYHARYAPDLLQRELERRSNEQPELAQSRLAHLKTCLEMLDQHLRQYISWRYEQQISLDEMAQRSGRSVAAVKKQLWQLRRRLQQCVQKKMAAEGDVS